MKPRSSVDAWNLLLLGNSEICLKQMSLNYFTQFARRLKCLYINFLELLFEDSSQDVLVLWHSGLWPHGQSSFHGRHRDWQLEVSGTHCELQWKQRGPNDICNHSRTHLCIFKSQRSVFKHATFICKSQQIHLHLCSD